MERVKHLLRSLRTRFTPAKLRRASQSTASSSIARDTTLSPSPSVSSAHHEEPDAVTEDSSLLHSSGTVDSCDLFLESIGLTSAPSPRQGWSDSDFDALPDWSDVEDDPDYNEPVARNIQTPLSSASAAPLAGASKKVSVYVPSGFPEGEIKAAIERFEPRRPKRDNC